MITFIEKLNKSWKSQNSLLCIGLDPDLTKLPAEFGTRLDSIFEFNREIIDATANWVCAYKPQIAYYSAVSAEKQLEKTIVYIKLNYPHIPVILDAKRGDIASTGRMYAMEAFERYKADAVTLNPYMGTDTLQPYLDYKNKGVIILCRTSNPSSNDFQSLQSDGLSISQHVARRAVNDWNANNNLCLVVGATYPDEIRSIRHIAGDIPLLIPGIGDQGGDLKSVIQNGITKTKMGVVINVSRSIIYANCHANFAKSASIQAKALYQKINFYRSITK